jgi:hypothetical protein
MKTHTERIDEVEGEYDLYHEYGMIEVQLVLQRLDDSAHDEAEAIYNGILVKPVQKFARIFPLWCKGSKEYRRVEIDAGLQEERQVVRPWTKNKSIVGRAF